MFRFTAFALVLLGEFHVSFGLKGRWWDSLCCNKATPIVEDEIVENRPKHATPAADDQPAPRTISRVHSGTQTAKAAAVDANKAAFRKSFYRHKASGDDEDEDQPAARRVSKKDEIVENRPKHATPAAEEIEKPTRDAAKEKQAERAAALAANKAFRKTFYRYKPSGDDEDEDQPAARRISKKDNEKKARLEQPERQPSGGAPLRRDAHFSPAIVRKSDSSDDDDDLDFSIEEIVPGETIEAQIQRRLKRIARLKKFGGGEAEFAYEKGHLFGLVKLQHMRGHYGISDSEAQRICDDLLA